MYIGYLFFLQNDDKAVTRLKRYISLCGVRRNYKKLLEGCRSVRSQVAALKKELEDLGVHGKWEYIQLLNCNFLDSPNMVYFACFKVT